MRPRLATLPLLFACAGFGCSPEAERPPDVLLVTFDTTRADRVGCYGHAAARTPALDGLATRGVRFERAYSHVPLTLPSHATLMSGVHPPGHGLHVNFQGRISDEVDTLAERLRARGYRTGAFVAAWVLNADFGLDRGFDVYDDLREQTTRVDQQAERPADQVVDAALAWLERDDEQPSFCWVHFYDPHDPYTPPDGFVPPDGDAYDGEIAYTDAQLGRLLEGLRGRGALERTVVVVTADHGESLGEHGETTHGLFIYDAVARVPMLAAGPGLAQGHVVDAAVGLVDLHPTLLELCGVEPAASLEGRSLAPALRGGTLPDESIYVESEYGLRSFGWAPLTSLVTRDWQYILAPRAELYELERDPEELENRVEDEDEIAARLREALGARMASGARRGAGAIELGPDDARQLSSLGYVAGRADDIRIEELSALRDPKEAVHVMRGTMRAKHLSDAGQHLEVVELLGPLLEDSPESDEVWSLIAKSLFELGRAEEAGLAYERSLRAVPDQADRILALGDCRLALEQVDAALAAYERALELDPELGQAHSRAGVIHARAGRMDRALHHFERFAELEPGSVNARFNYANALMAAQRWPEAFSQLEAALELEPQNARVLRLLPTAARASGSPDAELLALRRAVAALPSERGLVLRLAWRLAVDADGSAADRREALELAERASQGGAAAKPDVTGLDVLAAACAAQGEFERAIELATRAFELAEPGDPRAAIEARLALYRSGQPYRE